MRVDPPVDTDIRWLYEDARMLVVDKPADLPAHSSGAYRFHTLECLLRRYRPANTIHLVSRLDRETSGVTLVAKDPEMAAILGKAPKRKVYHVLVEGRFPEGRLCAAGRIRRTLARYPYLAAEREGRILGYAYAGPFHPRPAYDWSAEASIYVAEAARGSGVGGALYRALEQLLAAQGILNVNACIAVPCGAHDPYLTNHSAEFHAHWGYQLVGRFHQCGYKFGRWYDMIWMEKFLGEHPERPRAVVPFPQVDWAAVL